VKPIGVMGHVAIDRIITSDGTRTQLGGPPTYVSLVTDLLDVPLISATRVGGDFPGEYASALAAKGLDIRTSVNQAATTTRFILDYTRPERGLG